MADKQEQPNVLPSNWSVLDHDEKLEQIMITLSRMDIRQQAITDSLQKGEEDSSQLKLKLLQLEGKNVRLEKELCKVKSQCLDLQQRSMQDNLIFHGLPEKANEDCENTIIGFLKKDMKVSNNNIYSYNNLKGEIRIDVAHRSGKKSSDVNSKPRPIVVNFVTRKGKSMVLKCARNLKGTDYSVSEQLPAFLREQRMAQVPKMYDMRNQLTDKKKDRVRLVKYKLMHNNSVVDGEFEKDPLCATHVDIQMDYGDLFHSQVIEYEDSFFQAHAVTITSTAEASKAKEALYQNHDVSTSDHIMYVYRYTTVDDDELVEGYADDGEVRGSKEIRSVLNHFNCNNIFISVSRIHNGPNIGQKRFDIIRQVVEEVINLL